MNSYYGMLRGKRGTGLAGYFGGAANISDAPEATTPRVIYPRVTGPTVATIAGVGPQLTTGTPNGTYVGAGPPHITGAPVGTYVEAGPLRTTGTSVATYVGAGPPRINGTPAGTYDGASYPCIPGIPVGRYHGAGPPRINGTPVASYAGAKPSRTTGTPVGTDVGAGPPRITGTPGTTYVGAGPPRLTGTPVATYVGAGPPRVIGTPVATYVGAGPPCGTGFPVATYVGADPPRVIGTPVATYVGAGSPCGTGFPVATYVGAGPPPVTGTPVATYVGAGFPRVTGTPGATCVEACPQRIAGISVTTYVGAETLHVTGPQDTIFIGPAGGGPNVIAELEANSIKDLGIRPPVAAQQEECEIIVMVHNVVVAFSVGCRLNLREIGRRGIDVEFRRETGNVVTRLRKPLTTATIWPSGCITCTGAETENEAKTASRRYARRLQKLGMPVRFKKFRVVNVLGTCRMPWAIRIVGFYQKYRDVAQYEPELHPGVKYDIYSLNATMKIFCTGSITITAPGEAHIQEAIEHVFPMLYEFRRERSSVELEKFRINQEIVRKGRGLNSGHRKRQKLSTSGDQRNNESDKSLPDEDSDENDFFGIFY